MPFSPNFQKICLLSVAFSLNACYSTSLIPETKKVDYQSAKPAATLEIPPNLSQITQDEGKIVPESQGRGTASLVAYQTERQSEEGNLTVLPPVDKVKMQRLGNERWLSVAEKPENLWKILKSFWEETGFVLETERPETGIMETNWAENRAKLPDDLIRRTLGRFLDSLYSTGERDKFRTRLEPSTEKGYTDIFISHRGMEEVYTSSLQEDTRWQPRAPDPELEAEMLRRLMLRLGLNEEKAQSALKSTETAAPQAHIVPAANAQLADVLIVKDRFDRAWRRVGLALDRVGFTVEDRDRQSGVYFVRYVDADAQSAKKSWLEKVSFWKSAPQPSTRYRIGVKPEGEETRVSVLTAEGMEDLSPTAKKIIQLLAEQLR